MRRGLVLGVVLVALTFIGVASAGGYFKTARQTFYSDYIHYRATFDVYDSRGYCVKDEYGFYEDIDCEDYDDGNAPVDLRVMKMGPHPRIVYSERLSGYHGRVSTDLYTWEVDKVDCWHSKFYYRAILRLRDPITDHVVDIRTKKFSIRCG
jgi:hypothetical protein